MKRPQGESDKTDKQENEDDVEVKKQKIEGVCACKWREGDPGRPTVATLLLLVAQEDIGSYFMHWLKGNEEDIGFIESALVLEQSKAKKDEITTFNFMSLLDYVLSREGGEEAQKRGVKDLVWEEGDGSSKSNESGCETLSQEKLLEYFGSRDPKLDYTVSTYVGADFFVHSNHCCKIMTCSGFH